MYSQQFISPFSLFILPLPSITMSHNPLFPNQHLDDDCNDLWNEDTFYELDLHMVWHDGSGNWIPDEHRHTYYSEENNTVDWYMYCDYHGIQWYAPRILPLWAIKEMDQYYRDKHYGNDLDLTEDN